MTKLNETPRFGLYKDRLTWYEIAAHDPDYTNWVIQNVYTIDESLRDELKELMRLWDDARQDEDFL